MGALTANLRFLNGYANSSTGTFPDWFDATGITGFSLDNENALSTAIPDADAFFSTADLNIVSDGQVEWSQGSTLVTLSGSGVEGLSNLEPENISAALDEGVTNRQLTNFSVAYDDEELARFEVTSTGVTITTGDQSANLIGAAPNGLGALGETFDVFERFSGLFSEYDDERGFALAFFDQQNLSGLLIKNGEEEVLNASLSDRSFSMSAGGATFELDGVDLPNTSLGSMMDAGVRVIADNLRDDFGDHITAGDDGLVMAGYIGDDTLIGGAGDDDFYVGDGSSSADGDDWLYLNRVIADVRVNGVDITDDEAVSAAAFTRDGVLTVTSTDGNLSVTAEGIEALVFQDTFVDLDVLLSGATSAADEVGDATATVSQDLSAGGGDDTVLGGQVDDDLNGGEGNDDIDAGDDFVFDNTGDTTVEGGAGDDIVVAIGGNGNFTDTGEVTVVANEVNDFFCGGVWDDWFDAGSGNDILVGDIGSDRHYGNDTLNGSADNYLLQGGWGQDVFIFGNNDGEDTIARIDLDRIDFGNIGNVPLTGPDFQSGVDKIHLESAGFADLSGDSALAFAKVSDVTVDGVTFAQFDHNGTKINFHGLTLSDLSASDFDFV